MMMASGDKKVPIESFGAKD
jgi:hypothetical protein